MNGMLITSNEELILETAEEIVDLIVKKHLNYRDALQALQVTQMQLGSTTYPSFQ